MSNRMTPMQFAKKVEENCDQAFMIAEMIRLHMDQRLRTAKLLKDPKGLAEAKLIHQHGYDFANWLEAESTDLAVTLMENLKGPKR